MRGSSLGGFSFLGLLVGRAVSGRPNRKCPDRLRLRIVPWGYSLGCEASAAGALWLDEHYSHPGPACTIAMIIAAVRAADAHAVTADECITVMLRGIHWQS